MVRVFFVDMNFQQRLQQQQLEEEFAVQQQLEGQFTQHAAQQQAWQEQQEARVREQELQGIYVEPGEMGEFAASGGGDMAREYSRR